MHKEEENHPLSPRRWAILTVFALYNMANQFQWISYSTINDKIVMFYDVSAATVDWLSMVFMLAYIPLIFPATWLLDKKGLRITAYLGSFLNFLGAAVKCFSPYSSRFLVTFVGQVIAAISQVFILGLPARVAAVWFAEREVPLATAVGVFGTQLGVALGFLVPLVVPSVNTGRTVTNGTIQDDIYDGNLANLYYIKTGVTGSLFLLVLLVFRDKPAYPPNAAQATILTEATSTSYTQWIAILAKNLNFIALALTFGIMVGAFYAIGTLLNQLVVYYFEGQTENAGYIGVTLTLAGLLASVAFGFFLSYSGKYKETTSFAYLLALVCTVVFMIVLTYSNGRIWLVFVVAGFLGFFMTGYLPVGYELAAEITYPAPEGTTSGLLNCSAQIFGLILTSSMGELLARYGPLAANGLLVAALFVGTVATYFIRSDLRRTAVSQARTLLPSSSTTSAATIVSTVSF